MHRSKLGRLATAGLALIGLAAASFTGSATAANNTTTKQVTKYNHTNSGPGSWSKTTTGGAVIDFTEEAGSSMGSGALKISIPENATGATAEFISTQFQGRTIGEVESVAYDVLGDASVQFTVYSPGLPTEAYARLVHTGAEAATWTHRDASDEIAWYVTGHAGPDCIQASRCTFGEAVDVVGADAFIAEHLVFGGSSGSSSADVGYVDGLVIDFEDGTAKGRTYDFEVQATAPVVVGPKEMELEFDTDMSDLAVDVTGAYNKATIDFRLVDPETGAGIAGRKVNLIRNDQRIYKQTLGSCETDVDGYGSCEVPASFKPAVGDHKFLVVALGDYKAPTYNAPASGTYGPVVATFNAAWTVQHSS